MAINFPSSPSLNDTHYDATSGTSWRWTGVYWQNWVSTVTNESAAFNAFIVSGVIGEVTSWPADAIPSNFLECDGSEVSRTTYADLYAVIGDTYGAGDGSTTFLLPDLRGQFLRGLDESGTVDPDGAGRTIGDSQTDGFETHTHTYVEMTGQNTGHISGGPSVSARNLTLTTRTTNAGTDGGISETRPKNVSVKFCIRFAAEGTVAGAQVSTDLSTGTLNNTTLPSALATKTYIDDTLGSLGGTGIIGETITWITTTTPANFLECNGNELSRTTYADLFAVIGTTYGAGNGSTTFNLPDFRGRFLRGLDTSGSVDPDGSGRTVGDSQDDTFESHIHGSGTFSNYSSVNSSITVTNGTLGLHSGTGTGQDQVATSSAGDSETRPKNVAVRFLIRYAHTSPPPAATVDTDLSTGTNNNTDVPSTLAVQTYVNAQLTGDGGVVGEIKTAMLTEAQFQLATSSDWVLADGRDVTGSTYATVTGNTTIPDLRGQFLRGLDTAASVDPDGASRTLGHEQDDAVQQHKHATNYNTAASGNLADSSSVNWVNAGSLAASGEIYTNDNYGFGGKFHQMLPMNPH